jgi:hypothetical protein
VTAVQSSNLAGVDYSWSGRLTIACHSGSAYECYRVPYAIYAGLMRAESHGKYLHARIKKRYACRKLGWVKPRMNPARQSRNQRSAVVFEGPAAAHSNATAMLNVLRLVRREICAARARVTGWQRTWSEVNPTAAKIEKGEPVTAPGIPKNWPDAKALVTEDCIKRSLWGRRT